MSTLATAPRVQHESSCSCGGKCRACANKRSPLQRSAINRSPAPRDVPGRVGTVLRAQGRPLDNQVRARMEPLFGHDFHNVKVHSGSEAAHAAEDVGAHAFTVGDQVVFGAGEYQPSTSTGRDLIAHELTHVVQQRRGQQTSGEGTKESHSEAEADATARRVSAAQPVSIRQSAPLRIHRQAVARSHRFNAHGVAVVVRRSCSRPGFGFAAVEAATTLALDRIFNSECIEVSRRTRIQRNLTRHGLDIRCRRSASIGGDCAEATGFNIPANIMTLGSSSFAAHPDSAAACQPLASTVLHEIVHLTRGVFAEGLPDSCEASCFGLARGAPDLCRDIDVFGRRTRGGGGAAPPGPAPGPVPAPGAGPAPGPAPAPAPAPARPRRVTINITRLQGAANNSAADINTTNAVFRRNACALRVSAGTTQNLNAGQTAGVLGPDNRLAEPSGPVVSAEERRLVAFNRTAGRLTAYYVPGFQPAKRGTSLQQQRHGVADSLLLAPSAAVDTFPHELGHILSRNSGHHPNANNLMASGTIRNVGVDQVTAPQCTAFTTTTVYPQ